MLDERFAGASVTGDDVDDAWRESDFMTDFREGQGGDRSELSRLEDEGVAGGQGGRYLPRQHEQGKVPGDDLCYHSASDVAGKFLIQELRPSSVMIKVTGDERNIDIAAFPNWFAVVQCLENGKAT